MPSVVGVVHGLQKRQAFSELLDLTEFIKTLNQAFEASGKTKTDFQIVIKPNMMVFVTQNGKDAIVTDPELVEQLVDTIIEAGYTNIAVCEAQHDLAQMFKNHNVQFVSQQIGYKPGGRYRIADLTLEKEKYKYVFRDKNGCQKIWKDYVGRTWREADFRISFCKCKTHEQHYMTLTLKNIYGCMPPTSNIWRYHILNEVEDVTARSLANFPVHFAFVDGWLASDGFQGYKLPRPKPLRMFFGGADPVCVDLEVFRRAGLDWYKSQIIEKCIDLARDGKPPAYDVVGDSDTRFSDLVQWQNIDDETVEDLDILEELYLTWGIINLRPGLDNFDHTLFPPKNWFWRIVVGISKLLYTILKPTSWFKKWYRKYPPPDDLEKIEDGEFDTLAIFSVIWAAVKKLFDQAGVILWSSIVLLMLWGFHGNLEILNSILPKGWIQSLTGGLVWGNQLVSFLAGFFFVVLIPCVLIKWIFKERLRDYGLGWPKKNDRHKSWVAFWNLLGFTAILVIFYASNPAMRAEYPLFGNAITGWGEFLIYEMVYLLFFISIEFIFRGYLLFGLSRIRMPRNKSTANPPPLRFGTYAILIQMLAYTTWHYGKPVPEVVGTIIWGIVAAAIALRIQSLWPIIAAHWLYNVFLDLLIWKDIPEKLRRLF